MKYFYPRDESDQRARKKRRRFEKRIMNEYMRSILEHDYSYDWTGVESALSAVNVVLPEIESWGEAVEELRYSQLPKDVEDFLARAIRFYARYLAMSNNTLDRAYLVYVKAVLHEWSRA